MRSANQELVFATVDDPTTNASISNSIGVVENGRVQLSSMAVVAPLGAEIELKVESPLATLTVASSKVVEVSVSEECPPGGFRTPSGKCEICEKDTFSFKFPEECQQCPKGAVCNGGDQLWTKSGYWRTGPLSSEIWQCPLAGACLAGTPTSTAADICNEGFTSAQCGVCAEEYFYSPSEHTCRHCDASTSAQQIVIGVIMMLVLAALAVLGLAKARSIIDARRWLRETVWDVSKFKVLFLNVALELLSLAN